MIEPMLTDQWYVSTKPLAEPAIAAVEDGRIADKVNGYGKGKIVLAGLWTSVCIVGPALSA